MATVLENIPERSEYRQLVEAARIAKQEYDYTQIANRINNLNKKFSAFRDQLTDAVNLKVQGNGLTLNSTDCSITFEKGMLYDTDFVYVNVQLNHDKKQTSPIYPHIHWFQASALIPNFLLSYRWQPNLGAKVTSWTEIKCNSTVFTYTSGTINQICYSVPIAAPIATNLSDIIQFKIYRDTDGGSTAGRSTAYTGAAEAAGKLDVGVTAFDVHFEVDSLGSETEYVK